MSDVITFSEPPPRLRPLWPYPVLPPDFAAIVRGGEAATAEITLSPALASRAIQTTDTPLP